MLVHTLYIYIYILDTNILYTHVRLIPTLPTAQNNVSAKFAGIASAYQVDNFFSATQINWGSRVDSHTLTRGFLHTMWKIPLVLCKPPEFKAFSRGSTFTAFDPVSVCVFFPLENFKHCLIDWFLPAFLVELLRATVQRMWPAKKDGWVVDQWTV